MNYWSRTRKRIILSIVLFVVILLVGVPLYLILHTTPSCGDGVMNGDETGVDCGGSCQRLCNAESLPLVMNGDPRVLQIATSTFEVVSVFENPNPQAEIYRAQYALKIYAASSTLPIKTIEGHTFVPKRATFAIFEGPFNLEAGVIPTRASLEWQKDILVWRKNTETQPELDITNKTLSSENLSPRLEALVSNFSLESVSHVDLIALISDGDGNIFAASKTYIDTLAPGASEPVVFSWPRAFLTKAVDITILIRLFPDSTFIR